MAGKWQSSGMLVFEMYKHQANLGQKSMGPDHARCDKILKEISNIICNCRFPPLPEIEVINFGCEFKAKIYLFGFCGR